MINNRKVRLIQVAKEFKVGLNTIMDFLLKKGINVEGSPNSPGSPEVYAVLEKEFGSNRTITETNARTYASAYRSNRLRLHLTRTASRTRRTRRS